MRRRPTLTSLAAVAALALALSGCAPASVEVSGTWGDQNQQGMPALELGPNGALSGTDGCNQLVGEYVATGTDLIFENVASTMMFCEGVDTWLSALATASVAGDSMTIFDSSGVEIGSLQRAE